MKAVLEILKYHPLNAEIGQERLHYKKRENVMHFHLDMKFLISLRLPYDYTVQRFGEIKTDVSIPAAQVYSNENLAV